MNDLEIVIVTYRTKELLDKCLQSIYDGEYPFSYHVTVVDNNSCDGTPEMVVAKHPDALLVRNNKNTGFSVANNQGIRKSDSRHVLLLNPDTEVEDKTLAKMVEFLDRHPQIGITGCQLLNTDGTLQESWFNFPIPFSRYFEKFSFYPKLSHFMLGFGKGNPIMSENGAKRVDIIKGACLMIRRETINQIGLLDENSFLYADDIDWCIRARRRDWECYALTDANIVHHGYASTSQEPYITITSSRRSALYLYRKHYSLPFVAIWTTLIYLEIIYKLILNSIRIKLGKKDKKTESRYRAYKELAGEMFRKRKNGNQ
ncbi:MAG TPA: glycosyltransferase family 2 protein [bacterium]|nr:glycosyltransferase family 2 protein [bacterium]